MFPECLQHARPRKVCWDRVMVWLVRKQKQQRSFQVRQGRARWLGTRSLRDGRETSRLTRGKAFYAGDNSRKTPSCEGAWHPESNVELDVVRVLGEGMAYRRQKKRKVGNILEWQIKELYKFFQQTMESHWKSLTSTDREMVWFVLENLAGGVWRMPWRWDSG